MTKNSRRSPTDGKLLKEAESRLYNDPLSNDEVTDSPPPDRIKIAERATD